MMEVPIPWVDNPDFDNLVNKSCKVGQIVRDPSLPFANNQITFDSKFDFNANSGFKLKVRSSKVGYGVLLKLEDKTNGGIFKEATATATVGANEWEELTFDFAASESGKYDKIVLFFELNSTNGDTYFIDDFMLVSSGSGGPSMYGWRPVVTKCL